MRGSRQMSAFRPSYATGVGASPAVDFTYRLVGIGWAEATVSDGSSSATLTASYLEDALGELLEAIGTMLEGADEARCSWEEEPGEYRWVFQGSETDVHLRVLGFADVYSREPDHRGVVVFETRQPLRDIAEAVANGAQAVLDEYGEDEYLRRWVDFPFPTGHLEMVRERLSAG
jgi:hypothetical protein